MTYQKQKQDIYHVTEGFNSDILGVDIRLVSTIFLEKIKIYYLRPIVDMNRLLSFRSSRSSRISNE